jgi:hypothetical protein
MSRSRTALFALIASCLIAQAHAGSPAPGGGRVQRCGWFDNPSPGNATLTDRDGEWTVAQQGEHEAKGRWPAFGAGQSVRIGNGSAAYGCSCITGTFDDENHDVMLIASSRSLPLSVCRRDRALQGKEPLNPLKEDQAPR